MCLVGLFLAAAAQTQITTPPFPHPLITEILYAVPSGAKGDANADGTRDAVGDEFIELVNPHDKPIQLKGYTLMDADAWDPGAPKKDPPASTPTSATPGKKGDPSSTPAKTKENDHRSEVRFVFPELELKPGEIVVVFNGYKQNIQGNVGDSTKAAAKNEKFHNAYVFTMKNDSPYAALGNEGDFVVLMAPGDKPVHVVKWGTTTKNPPKDAIITEEAPKSFGSVQRNGVHGKLEPHRELKGELEGTLFSPGVFSLEPSVDAPKKTTNPSSTPSTTPTHDKPKK
jgi:hypothetical protein